MKRADFETLEWDAQTVTFEEGPTMAEVRAARAAVRFGPARFADLADAIRDLRIRDGRDTATDLLA